MIVSQYEMLGNKPWHFSFPFNYFVLVFREYIDMQHYCRFNSETCI